VKLRSLIKTITSNDRETFIRDLNIDQLLRNMMYFHSLIKPTEKKIV